VPYTVVVVLHESAAEIDVLLHSADAHLAARPQLVAVDTGRDDGGAARCAAWGAEVLERRDNPGFGAASNAGLGLAAHDVTVLLNPDCELLDGSLDALAELAREHPGALHAPRLLNADGSVQDSAHPLPGTPGALLAAALPPALAPRALRDRLEPWRGSRAHTVGWAIGACLAAPTAALRALGPFDTACVFEGEHTLLGLLRALLLFLLRLLLLAENAERRQVKGKAAIRGLSGVARSSREA